MTGQRIAQRRAVQLDADVVERLRRRVGEDPAVPASAGIAELRAAVARAVRAEGLLLPAGQLAAVARDVGDRLTGLGPIELLLRDPDVTDVMVNGAEEVWVERRGRLERTDVRFADAEEVRAAVVRAVAPLGLRFDAAQPTVDARLPDGSRLHALLPPLVAGGPAVTVRRFRAVRHSWEDLAALGAVPAAVAGLLRAAVAERRAVIVCGRTGAGKTTLLGALLGEVAADERVVVIEDARELRPSCPHVVSLEARRPNAEGVGGVTVRDLVRQALRMRPDRIIVGEVRGVELVDVLQALATGHEGCMTTVHARAADEALVRLEGLALLAGLPLEAARAQLRVALDLVVSLSRGPDGQRGVVEVADVERRGSGPVTARVRWERTSW